MRLCADVGYIYDCVVTVLSFFFLPFFKIDTATGHAHISIMSTWRTQECPASATVNVWRNPLALRSPRGFFFHFILFSHTSFCLPACSTTAETALSGLCRSQRCDSLPKIKTKKTRRKQATNARGQILAPMARCSAAGPWISDFLESAKLRHRGNRPPFGRFSLGKRLPVWATALTRRRQLQLHAML